MSNQIQGIDVSSHQGIIDWKKVKAAGKEFAFIRVGWCGYDGRIAANGGLDKRFHSNIQAATEAGVKVGVYVYSYAKTPEAARIAAQETLELVKPYTLEYPIAFDIEDSMYTHMNKASNTAITQAFLSCIEQARYYAMLYTYKYFAIGNLEMSQLANYDVWIAQYAAQCNYQGKYGIWQYAGDAGVCGGVSTACDLNVSYKDYAYIIKAAGLNKLNSDTETPPTDPTLDFKTRIIMLEETIKAIKDLIKQVE